MIRWVAGVVRRAGRAILLLLLLPCGAEVALRLADLRANRTPSSSRPASLMESLAVPSWTTYQELRPSAMLRIAGTKAAEPHILRINSFGVRGPEPDLPKPRDLYRILCLGDERLLAVELSDDEHLGARLQERLQPETKLRVEAWNAGVPGACPLTQYLQLTHRLAALQPDLVLSFVHADDLTEDQAYRRFTRVDRRGLPLACRHATLGRLRKPSMIAAWRQEFRLVDWALDWAGAKWKERTAFDALADGGMIQAELARLQHDAAAIERTLQPLDFLSNWCRDSYAAHAVVLVSDSYAGTPTESPFAQALADFARERSLPLIHLAAAEEMPYPAQRPSWTPQDHHDFAEEIARRVVSDVSGPWNSPYFQSQPKTITPASHQENRRSPRILQ